MVDADPSLGQQPGGDDQRHEATARSNLIVLRVGGDGPTMLLTGRDADEIRRTDAGWRIKRRRVHPGQ